MLALITIICALVSVALYTLVERKIMASIQRRQGPNLVGLWGLLQPLADGGKLAFKYKLTPKLAEHLIFNFAPVIILFSSLLSWFLIIQGHITTKNNFLLANPLYLYQNDFSTSDYIANKTWNLHENFYINTWSAFNLYLSNFWNLIFEFGLSHPFFEEFYKIWTFILQNWVQSKNTISVSILCILAISSLNVYSLILAGWASNSKYAFFGSLRSGAQMISYEVSIGLTLIPVLLLAGCSLNFKVITELNQIVYHWNFWFFFFCFCIFIVSMLAETNRTPFDLTEAEAELVAGYNVEYSALTFAMFFLAEYSNMLIMSVLGSIFYLGSFYTVLFVLQFFFFIFIFVLIRATFPRYKYNELMDLGWKNFLPILLGFFVFVSVGIFWSDLQYYGL